MPQSSDTTRRAFISVAAASAGGLLLTGSAATALSAEQPEDKAKEVSPAEDLMREHGLLRRILLVYGEAIPRLENVQQLPAGVLPEAAGIVRSFIEQYHEKLEEDHLFPRFRKANKLVDLVQVLLDQHQAGRRLTDNILRLGAPDAIKTAEDRRDLVLALKQFIRMYSPHAAREDTVLFPAFHQIVTAKEYDELGDAFEDKEHELFGDNGFEKMVDRVAALEKALGIDDLAQFTPKA